MKYHFCGIGGSGMSAIAQVLQSQGHSIQGSDRNCDQNRNQGLFEQLAKQGARLFPQDGSGIDTTVDEVIVSTAIEGDNPEIRQATQLGIRISKRAEILARLCNTCNGIAVGGTSGKSTVTAMIGHILTCSGKRPTIVNGGVMNNFADSDLLGNAVCGDPTLYVIEADESDGSIEYYTPDIAVVNNISKDHKSLDELYTLFGEFLGRARTAAIVNIDCIHKLNFGLPEDTRVTFGLGSVQADIIGHSPRFERSGCQFVVDDVNFRLRTPGRHNLMNALAAIACCANVGISLRECSDTLEEFLGVARRMQIIGEFNGVTVIDDFAHNPDKITATLSTLSPWTGRLLVVFQPHGFAPTRFVKDGLINAFAETLRSTDLLAMPRIFYAGGTADRTISAGDLIKPIRKTGIEARYIPERSEIARWFVDSARHGDTILVMGARDGTLTGFAQDILARLQKKRQ